jgi:hypothetical protein
VRIHGIPFDMTLDEAAKICRILTAMVEEKNDG